jgi:hypothetical protein
MTLARARPAGCGAAFGGDRFSQRARRSIALDLAASLPCCTAGPRAIQVASIAGGLQPPGTSASCGCQRRLRCATGLGWCWVLGGGPVKWWACLLPGRRVSRCGGEWGSLGGPPQSSPPVCWSGSGPRPPRATGVSGPTRRRSGKGRPKAERALMSAATLDRAGGGVIARGEDYRQTSSTSVPASTWPPSGFVARKQTSPSTSMRVSCTRTLARA